MPDVKKDTFTSGVSCPLKRDAASTAQCWALTASASGLETPDARDAGCEWSHMPTVLAVSAFDHAHHLL